MYAQGSVKKNFEVKLFGGAQSISSTLDPGEKNSTAFKNILKMKIFVFRLQVFAEIWAGLSNFFLPQDKRGKNSYKRLSQHLFQRHSALSKKR